MAVQYRFVDQKIWRACAGSTVHMPNVHSRVYYFPQGHLEQASSAPSYLSPLLLSKPVVLCRVVAVQYLADPCTDEVFSRMILHPIHGSSAVSFGSSEAQGTPFDTDRNCENDDKIVSFVKILTPSDANNGGGFSVPRFCADSIFPPLDLKADPPVQSLSVTDIQGTDWTFRHIYRGTPRRHLLTTGWSKFVNNKKLVAGDSVVFMKNSNGEMFVGIRRGVRLSGSVDYPRYGGMMEKREGNDFGIGLGGAEFSRSTRGKLPPKAVAEAAEMAAKDMPFEVSHCPGAGWSDFVVKAELVDEAMSVVWAPGFRVKTAVETEDSSRITWFQGSVSAVRSFQNGSWQGSPWRILEVKWDEPNVFQHAKRINPWQVEVITLTPPRPNSLFQPLKKFRAVQNSGILSDEAELFFSVDGLNNSTMGRNPPFLNYDTFPAGMQGARQNLIRGLDLSKTYNENTLQKNIGNIDNNGIPKLKYVSTELNICSSSDDLSPDSQSSVLSFGSELMGNRIKNPEKIRHTSFQLFGKVIHIKLTDEIDFDDGGCIEDDDSKRCDEPLNNPPDISFSGDKAN